MKFTYPPGDRPLEGYTIKHGVGRGGFGEVYRAVSDGGKEVALKLVQRNLEVELRGVGQCLNLKHPNLVALFDVRQAENGDHWVVMEYVAGESLDRVVARHPQGMPPGEVLAWLRGLGEGVAYLHEQGIVHRDLKPGNLFVENGAVKIGDYGLSKFISASRRSGQTGSVGTVHYMAPEVVNGRYGKEVDLYALGVILYEMLTGRVPFDGQSPGEILMKHLTAWPDLNAVPLTFRPAVARLLEKDPQRRYPSVRELLAELDGAPITGPAAEVCAQAPQIPGWCISAEAALPLATGVGPEHPQANLQRESASGQDERQPFGSRAEGGHQHGAWLVKGLTLVLACVAGFGLFTGQITRCLIPSLVCLFLVGCWQWGPRLLSMSAEALRKKQHLEDRAEGGRPRGVWPVREVALVLACVAVFGLFTDPSVSAIYTIPSLICLFLLGCWQWGPRLLSVAAQPLTMAQPQAPQAPGRASGGAGGNVAELSAVPESRQVESLAGSASYRGAESTRGSPASEDFRKLLRLSGYLGMALACGAMVGLLTAGVYYALNYHRLDDRYDRVLVGPEVVRASLIAAAYASGFVILFLLCRAWGPRVLSPLGKVKSCSVLRLGIAAAIGTGVGILAQVLGNRLLRLLGAADSNGVVYESDRNWLAFGLGLLAFGISAWSLFFVFGEENLKVHSEPAQTSSPTQPPTSDAGLATGPWQPQADASDAHPLPVRR
jgi:hypothetical protein